MKQLVGVLLLVGCVLVYWQYVLGVLILVAAAYAVPIVVKQIHDERAARARGLSELVARACPWP